MASITLIFKNTKDFFAWAKNNKLEFLAEGGASANSNTLSSGKSLLFTDKGTFDNWTNMRLTYGAGIAQGINTVADAQQAWHHYKGSTAAAASSSALSAMFGMVQVTLSGLSRAKDDNQFTQPVADAELGEVCTALASSLAVIPGAQPLAALAAIGGLAYTAISMLTGKSMTLGRVDNSL